MQKCSLDLNRVYYQTTSTIKNKFLWYSLNFLIFLWSASLAHAQLQNAYLLAVWEPGGHLRVCDTMPPTSVMGDDNLIWQTEGAGIWEATAEEPGESLLQVSVNERPHCSGTISQDGQYYPTLEVQDGFPKGKISGSTQAVMLRAPQNRRQNQRSISEKQTPALPLPFADRSVSAARAEALLGAGGAGGFFQQFPPRPPFPGFPYQEAKSQQGLTTAILALLFIAQGYLPFPNSPEQPLIYVGGYGESVALYQDDLLWLVQHFHLDNDHFQQQLSAWLSHTFWLGGPIADWFQYEAQQRKKQAITQMCHWLTRIKTTSDNFLTSLQVTETGEFDDFIIENKLMNSGFARSLISIFSRAREEGALIHQLPIGTKDNRDVTVGSESKPKTSSSELRSPSHLFSLSGTIGGSNNGGDGATPPTSEGYVCVLCEKSFLTPSDLKKHVNDLHPSLSGDVMPQPVEQISEEPMHKSESSATSFPQGLKSGETVTPQKGLAADLPQPNDLQPSISKKAEVENPSLPVENKQLPKTNISVDDTITKKTLDALTASGFIIKEYSNESILFDVSPRIGKRGGSTVDFTVNRRCLNNKILEESLLTKDIRSFPDGIFPVVRSVADKTFSISWYQSNLLNKRVKNNKECEQLTHYHVSLSTEDHDAEKMVEICTFEGVVGRKSEVDYISTAEISACHAIILWDKINRTACLCHHLIDWVTSQGLSNQVKLLVDDGSLIENIEAIIVGGIDIRMGWESGYFFCIKPTMENLGIPISETYLGNTGDRPSGIIFDLSEGKLHSYSRDMNVIEYTEKYQEACSSKTEKDLSSKRAYTIFDTKDESVVISVTLSEGAKLFDLPDNSSTFNPVIKQTSDP